MGAVAIQTQCCLSKRDDEWEDDDEDSAHSGAQEGTAVQLVEPMPWHRRSGGGFADAPGRPQAAVSRSLSEATTIVPNAPPR